MIKKLTRPQTGEIKFKTTPAMRAQSAAKSKMSGDANKMSAPAMRESAEEKRSTKIKLREKANIYLNQARKKKK